MIVHVFNDQKKFSLGFFRFLKDSGFDLGSTSVWHYGKGSGEFEQYGVKPRFIRNWFWPFGHGKMYRDLKAADRIVIHSLASPFRTGSCAARSGGSSGGRTCTCISFRRKKDCR